jgi:hypothetical protein
MQLAIISLEGGLERLLHVRDDFVTLDFPPCTVLACFRLPRHLEARLVVDTAVA